MRDFWQLGMRKFTSRLLVGTGKYKTGELAKAAIAASGAEIITMAVRRYGGEYLQDSFPAERYTYLPNSAGCRTAEDALRCFSLAREITEDSLVKLELVGHEKTLFPDMAETLKATSLLTKEGFEVMAYIADDPYFAKEIESAGAAALMPLASPIGSGHGIQNRKRLELMIEEANVPVIIDAGIGTASDATIAMEMGAEAVLLNSAIAYAKDPVQMAESMKHAVIAGRLSFLAGRMAPSDSARASSPIGAF